MFLEKSFFGKKNLIFNGRIKGQEQNYLQKMYCMSINILILPGRKTS
jgi:hypothetical protein